MKKTKELTLVEFKEKFERGDFNAEDVQTQIAAGWYDWFCRDSALCCKTKKLAPKVVSIIESKKFDKNKCYVFFKNNCPCVGALYDQFSICDYMTGYVLFCCQHLEKGSHGCERAHWEIYAAPDFGTPAVSGDWRDCKRWFLDEK